MKIYGVRVWVDDMDAARKFYGQTLGLTAAWDYGAAMGYDLGPTLIVELDAEEGLAGRFVGISLSVDDIAATHADLTAKGVEFLGPPETMPWGGTLAHFKDPSGNVLTLLGSA